MLSALLASFLATAAVSTWIDLHRQADLETGRLTQTARVIGSLASDAVARGDRVGSFSAIRSVSQMPDVNYARIVSREFGLLAETGSGSRLMTDADMSGDDARLSIWSVLSTRSIQVTVPVMSEGRAVGSMTLFSRTPELRGRVLSTIWTTLAGAVFAMIAGLVVALRLGRRISSPIVTLANEVRSVHASGDYSASLDLQADGEVGDLVAGFDDMLKGLRERDARIAAQVAGLEQEVASRTGELVIARDSAEKANAAKSDFLAVMSHEIRTPLNGILALSDMLAASDLPQRQQRYAEVISKSGKSLLSIINDILDFSKVEAGKMELEAVETDLAEAAEDVAALFSGKAFSKGLDLAVFVDPTLPAVLADPVRLRQVISNLVNNAIKFTDQGGVLIIIQPDTAASGRVRIAVQDTGPGIPADKLPTLFDAFTQADQSTTRKYGGTGLGLAICDRLVRSMGGEWDLSSRVGEGSTFAFSAPFARFAGEASGADPFAALPDGAISLIGLPDQTRNALERYLLAWGVGVSDRPDAPFFCGVGATQGSGPGVIVCDDETQAESVRSVRPDSCVLVRPLRRAQVFEVARQLCEGRRPVLKTAGRRLGSTVRFPGLRVLVVDDSEVNREVASEALSRLDVVVTTADDGQQALDLLRNQDFDLTLMDGSMPVLDGYEAVRLLRAEEASTGRARAPVVALTAHVVGMGAESWREAGMDGVIHKPFVLDDLVQALTRFHPGRAVAAPAEAAVRVQDDDVAAPRAGEVASGEAVAGLFDPAIRRDMEDMAHAGRADFVDRVHGLYAENAPLRLAEVEAALRSADTEALARAAHALKSMSLSLGAVGVAGAAGRMETMARAGETPPADSFGVLRTLLAETLSAIGGQEPQRPEVSIAGTSPSAASASEAELAAAISGDQLFVHYQPLVDRQGRFCGKAEALVRWMHPVRGRLSPDDFIPRLEADGVVSLLTDFMLARAMSEMKARPDVCVAVNVSAGEFQMENFPTRVREALDAAGFPARNLEIEVTETAMLDVAAAARTVDGLRAIGCGVALDDFGAGYTSLHALRDLRFTTLKVDRSFVDICADDTASAAIVHAVIGVGRALGMKVVCEGVETSRQADFLRIAGAHYLQGYHFHRPCAVNEIPSGLDTAA